MRRNEYEFNEINDEFKLRVLDNHYRGAYDCNSLSEFDDLYYELLENPEKLEQVLKDEFGSGERYGVKYILESAWDNYRRYGYI
jgi:hypothetical protein